MARSPLPPVCVNKVLFRTQLCPSFSLLSAAALVLHQQSWVVGTELGWPAKPAILTIWLFTEKACRSLVKKNFPGCRCCFSHFMIGEMRLREVKLLAHGHTALKWQRHDLDVGLSWSVVGVFEAVLSKHRVLNTWKGAGTASATTPRSSEESMRAWLALGHTAEAGRAPSSTLVSRIASFRPALAPGDQRCWPFCPEHSPVVFVLLSEVAGSSWHLVNARPMVTLSAEVSPWV